MHRPALVLSPSRPLSDTAAGRLRSLLTRLEFLGEPDAARAARFRPGPRLSPLLCFIGCSPNMGGDIEIELVDEGSGIRIIGVDAGLALPADELLTALESLGGGDWRWRSATAED